MRVVVVLVLATLAGAAAQEHPGAAEDAEDVPCKPQLAEKCWSDVVGHVDCLLNPRSTRTHVCQRLNHTELCKVLEDALRCSTDVAENGCVLRSGRENFDFWIRGLEAVNTKLCFEGQMATVVAYAECWDVLRFTRCVQHTVDRLQHVVDLADLLTPHHGHDGHDGHDGHGDLAAGEQLRAADSRQQCHLAMLRLSTCGATAATLNPAPVLADPMRSCLQAAPVDVINEMLAAYFSASECGNGGGGSGGSPCPSYGLPHQEALAFTTTLAALTEPPPAAPAGPGVDPARPAPAEDGDHLPATPGASASGSPAPAAYTVSLLLAVVLSINLL